MRTAQPDQLIFRLDHIITAGGHAGADFTLTEHRADVFTLQGNCPHCRFTVRIENESSERLANRLADLKRSCSGKKNRGPA